MKALKLIKKTREYLDYLEEHILNVEKAWSELQDKCKDMRFMWDDYYYFSIQDAVEAHDISKLSEQEFVQYRKAFYSAKNEPKYDMSEAWEHHKRENPHHWENWTELGWGNPAAEVHCVHMVIDWIAMGYKFGDTAQFFYEKNQDKINIPKEAVSFIYKIFRRLDSRKENKTSRDR